MSRVAAVLSLLLISTCLLAQQEPLAQQGPLPCKKNVQGRLSVGVALEGGVALGLAHVGALRWLESRRIPVDCIAGTSMGALIGALYSMGYSPEKPPVVAHFSHRARGQKTLEEKNYLETFVKDHMDGDKWEGIFFDLVDYPDLSFSRKIDRRVYPNSLRFRLNRSIHLPEGVVPGNQVGLIFDDLSWRYYNLQSFDDLPIPFRSVATDLQTHKSVKFGGDVLTPELGGPEGRLSEALRATMSVPVYFSPLEVTLKTVPGRNPEPHSYVDGGVLDNLPVDALAKMGADIIIAVHLNQHGQTGSCQDSPGKPASDSNQTLVTTILDTLSLITSPNEQTSIGNLSNDDWKRENHVSEGLCINVDVSGIQSTDFFKWDELINCRGFCAAEDTNGFVDHLLHGKTPVLDENAFDAYKEQRHKRNQALLLHQPRPSYLKIEVTEREAAAKQSSNAANENSKKQLTQVKKEESHESDLTRWIGGSLGCTESPRNSGRYSCPKYLPARGKDKTGCRQDGRGPASATDGPAGAQPPVFTECHAKHLAEQLNRMVGTGRFSRLGYHLVPPSDGSSESSLVITAQQADYTGAIIQPVIAVDGSDYTTPIFALGARFTAFDVGPVGSEWRGEALLGSRYGFSTEYYQPFFHPTSNWFLAPRFTAESSPFYIYHKQDQLAHYQLRTISGAADLGYNFGRSAQLRLGYEAASMKLSRVIGADILPFTSDYAGTTSLKFSLDRLQFPLRNFQGPAVPNDGGSFSSSFDWHDSWLGGKGHFPTASAGFEFFKSLNGRKSESVFVKGDAGSTLGYINKGLPIFTLGSPLKLAAYGTNELLVNQYAYGSAGYIHHFPKLVGGTIYALGYFEVAKPYGLPSAPSLPRDGAGGIVYNSIVGPLFVGGSVGDDGHGKFFFYLGKLF